MLRELSKEAAQRGLQGGASLNLVHVYHRVFSFL